MSESLSVSLGRARAMATAAADDAALACLAAALDACDAAPDAVAVELECQARDLRLKLLLRNGRYVEALSSMVPVLPRLAGERFSVARARLLAPLGLAYVQVGLTAHAMRCASAAFLHARKHHETLIAARALECIGICYMTLGDCPQGERLTLEALGMMQQQGDATDIEVRLSNALYLACMLHDAYRDVGDAERAEAVLSRCVRLAAQGDKLQARAGAWASCLWRSNRAGWLRRRGALERAEADIAAVRDEAARHGWHVIERHAHYELGLAARRHGHLDEALAWLARVPIRTEAAIDSFDISMRAHHAMRDIEHARGAVSAAKVHQDACAELQRRRAVLRNDVAERLGTAADVAAMLLPPADRARVDAEIARLAALVDATVARAFDPRVPAQVVPVD